MEGCLPPHWGWVWGPSLEDFGTFSLEMARFGANSVVYFNRNVRKFTARTKTATCIHILLAAGGRGVRSNQSNPPCYGPVSYMITYDDMRFILTTSNKCFSYANRNCCQKHASRVIKEKSVQ